MTRAKAQDFENSVVCKYIVDIAEDDLLLNHKRDT